ncbi:MAG: SET domain-containing protein [Saprospiraceae bacterium]|jgi:SET domain-containing protein
MVKIGEIAGMKGLFATTPFEKGDLVIVIEGKKLPFPTRTSVQVGINEHIDVKEPIMFINHKCDANISLKKNTFVAIRGIEAGEEITFNYNDSEEVLSNPFVCKDCGQNMKGSRFIKEFPCKKKA